jgi:mono/diheme cytochrome c family protein
MEASVRAGFSLVLCSFLAFGVWAGIARAQTKASIDHGHEIAQRVCAGCHAIDGQPGGTIRGTDVPSFRSIADKQANTTERLQSFIMTPHPPMPAIPLELAEIRDVVSYIRSLK